MDKIAARMSASYGKFQVMGFNFAIYGYGSVDVFYDEMQVNEGNHLEAFVGYVKHVRLGVTIRTKNWVEFAERYNGPEYCKKSHDKKMADAYKKFSKQTWLSP